LHELGGTKLSHNTRIIMEAIQRTKAIIDEAQQAVDQTLSKAQKELEEAKQRAELKLNDLAMDVDRIGGGANRRSLRSSPMTILLSSTLILGLCGLIVYYPELELKMLPSSIMVTSAELLSSCIGVIHSYPIPLRIPFFVAAMLYPILAVMSCQRSRRSNKNVTLVDRASQTHGEEVRSRAEGVIALALPTKTKDERGSEVDVNSTRSDSSVSSSLDDDDDDESGSDDDDVDVEEVHFRVYVRLVRLVGSEWKKYGPLAMSLSHKSGKPCMIFRNDIGVVHLILPIAKEMTFEKVQKKCAYIRFMSIEDEMRGLECFMLQVSRKVFDKLHVKLVEMAT
jgi:hypothetical protein